MSRKPVVLFLTAVGVAVAFHVRAQDKILVRVPADFDKAAPIVSSVKAECAVDTLIGTHVFQGVSEKFPGALQVRELAEADGNKVVNLTILSVYGVGGGSWSGPKSISVRAELMQNGQVIATSVKQRSSTGGVFGGMMGTCAIMERIAVVLGKDIAAWLASPAPAPGGSSAKPAAAAGPSAADAASPSTASPEEKAN